MLELDFSARGNKLHSIGRVWRLLASIEQREHAPRRGICRLNLRDDARHLIERLGVLIRIAQKRLNLAHGQSRRHASDNARAANHRYHCIDDVVDKTRPGVRKRTHKLRVLACRVQLRVELIKALFGMRAIGKCVHQFLLAHILLDMPAKLTLNALLGCKALVGKFGDKPRCKNGQRRYKHHHDSHGNRDGEHKHQGSHDSHHATKQLGKALKQAVAHLINVVYHTADKVAMRMGIDKREGHARELIGRFHTHVAHRLVGEAVYAITLDPLEDSSEHHHNGKLDDDWGERGKVHLTRIYDAVDTLADQDRRIELQRHGDGRRYKRDDKRRHMRTHVRKQATRDLTRRHGRNVALGPSQIIEVVVARNTRGHRRNRTGRCIRIHLARPLCGCGLVMLELREANLTIKLTGLKELIMRT